jgi:hypothetical protein
MAEQSTPKHAAPDAEVTAHVSISRLQAAYADVVNRRTWDELGPLFEPDAAIRIDTVTREPFELSGPEALWEFVGAAVERFAFFEFVILNSHIELPGSDDPDAARARIFMCEVRREVDTLDWSVAYGVYHDRYRRSAGGWRFARRDYQSLTRTDGQVFPFPHHLGQG